MSKVYKVQDQSKYGRWATVQFETTIKRARAACRTRRLATPWVRVRIVRAVEEVVK